MYDRDVFKPKPSNNSAERSFSRSKITDHFPIVQKDTITDGTKQVKVDSPKITLGDHLLIPFPVPVCNTINQNIETQTSPTFKYPIIKPDR
eukprot:UN21391